MKLWFYYAKAGGGHYAPAKALAEEFKSRKLENTEVKLVDMAERASIFFRVCLENGYVYLTQKAPFLYKILYEISRIKVLVAVEFWLANLFVKPSIKARLIADQPSAIIATFFLVSPLRRAMQELKINIPIIVLVTEPYSAPPIWFYYKDLNYIVSSETARRAALNEGVPAENIHRYQQVVNHDIASLDMDKLLGIKAQYNLDPAKKNVLLIGGANGLPGGVKIFLQLLKSDLDVNYIVICGNNEKTKKEMEDLSKKINKKSVVLGFVENISELIAISDLVITKAGAGVIWETLLNKKPVLITHYIYGQERGTMEFVTQNGLGWYESNPKQVVKKIKFILNDVDLRSHLDQKYEEMALKPGNKEVIEYIERTIA